MKRICYTSDPYEPSCTIGVYETEEQRQHIIDAHIKASLESCFGHLGENYFREQLFEEDFSIGEYYP